MGGPDLSEKITFKWIREREVGARQAKSSGKNVPEEKGRVVRALGSPATCRKPVWPEGVTGRVMGEDSGEEDRAWLYLQTCILTTIGGF